MSSKAEEALPHGFADEEALEDFMTRPTDALVADLGHLSGDIVVLGVGGKMGPTLARLAKRAAPSKRVIGVARFSDRSLVEKLERWNIETIQCDLLDRAAVARLPTIENVVFMAGRKFGTSGAEHLTWAMNAMVPALVAEYFRESRIVSLSTACVYPYTNVLHQGATEDSPAIPPPGEYANSCLARERMFEYFSHQYGTPGRSIRLSYAIDMRYGVLHDVARKVFDEETINLSMGHANVIWQGDANSQILRALCHVTEHPTPLNVSGPETTSIRALAEAFGPIFGKAPKFSNSESDKAWLMNTSQAQSLFGKPAVSLPQMIEWTADWIERGQPELDHETHYDVRNGSY